ncbi:MAG: RDD family protein [Candidatus Hydrogenedens sp.]|nr:RDD family protein [Candidatus Hydrogenedens sp.]
MTGRSLRYTIETPEGITFALYLAGPTSRFLAWGIDMLAKAALFTLLSYTAVPFGIVDGGLAVAYVTVAYFFVDQGYSIALEYGWRGQTLGKRLLGLRVIDEQGLRLAFSQVVVRNLMRFVDGIPFFYAVGGVAMVLSPRLQRLGDYAANTIVVRAPRPASFEFARTGSAKYNSFRAYPHIEARLRQKVPPEMAALALETLARRESLAPAERLDLMRRIADYLRDCAPFPTEATVGITDEQYLRNAVDSLFRTGASKRDAA